VILVGAPLVLVVGLGVYRGVEKGSALVKRVERWGRLLESSPDPVVMGVGAVPVVSQLHVDGHRLGKLDTLVVLRQQPGAIDSLRLVVVAETGALEPYGECRLLIDPHALEGKWPLEGVKHIVRCVSDTTDLVPFGSLVLAGAEGAATLHLRAEDLPCAHASAGADACRDLRTEMQRLREEIRREVRQEVRAKVQP
jgi:hypothetical protein